MSENKVKPAKPRKELKVPTGYPPEVKLLPPEVGQQKAASRARSRAILVAIIAVGVVVLAAAGSNLYSFQRLLALQGAQAQTKTLIIQQGEYNNVRAADQMVKSTTSARIFAMSTEISLNDLVRALASKFVPDSGAGVYSYGFETATPIQTYGESTSLLDPDRLGQLTLQIGFPSVAAADEWIRAIRDIKGVAGSALVSVERQEEGSYQASVIVFIDEFALLHRFDGFETENSEETASEPTPSPTGSPDPATTPTPDGETTEEESGS
ncbi:MAG: fimbrial assembly protein [Rhodoglobus sp.]